MRPFLIRLSVVFNCLTILIILAFSAIYHNILYEKIWLRKHATVVMLGDSHTDAVDWRDQIGRGDIKNSGLPGLTTSHFQWMLHDKVLRYTPEICYIEGGGNDLGAGIPTARIIQNLSSIIDTLQHHKIKPILQSVIITPDPSKNTAIDSLNMQYQDLAKKKGIEFLDINDHLRKNGISEYLPDRIHLKESAHIPWAKIIKSNLIKNSI